MDRRLRAARVPLGCLAALAIVAATIWAIGRMATLPDRLMAEAPSPDGELVARSWCMDGCDVTDSRTVTVSPAQRNVGIRRDSTGLSGDVPADEVAARVSIEDDSELALRWTGARTLRVDGPCLTGGGGRPPPPVRVGGAEIRFVGTAGRRPCRRAS